MCERRWRGWTRARTESVLSAESRSHRKDSKQYRRPLTAYGMPKRLAGPRNRPASLYSADNCFLGVSAVVLGSAEGFRLFRRKGPLGGRTAGTPVEKVGTRMLNPRLKSEFFFPAFATLAHDLRAKLTFDETDFTFPLDTTNFISLGS